MAILSTITCERCHHQRDVNHSPSDRPPKTCHPCQAEVAEEKKQAHLAELKTLSVEERLARIEEWIYNYKPPVPWSEVRF